ncbi:MAG: hypothetical protein AAGA23_17005 [Pseudomonadota bacterium]
MFRRSSGKRLAIELGIAVIVAWASLQLGEVYAQERTAACAQGLPALSEMSLAGDAGEGLCIDHGESNDATR